MTKEERAQAARRARKVARIQVIVDKSYAKGYTNGFSSGAVATEAKILEHAGELFKRDLDAAGRAVREVHHTIRDQREHSPVTGLRGEVPEGSVVSAFKSIKRA